MENTKFYKYLTLFGVLGAEAWLLWNPQGWVFQWEPLLAFVGSLATYVGLEYAASKKRSRGDDSAPEPGHPNDRALYAELVELLPSSGVMEWIRTWDFGGAFDRQYLEPVSRFNYEWDNAEHVFIDPEIEATRKLFLQAVKKFCTLIATHTVPTASGWQSAVPDRFDADFDLPATHREAIRNINDAADRMYKAHQELVLLGRRKLHV